MPAAGGAAAEIAGGQPFVAPNGIAIGTDGTIYMGTGDGVYLPEIKNLGTSIVAAKLELRLPLLSALTGSSRIRYGSLPVDAFAFADAGTGWGGETRFGPQDSGGRFVRSIGAGVRGNLFGLVVEASAIRPFDLRKQGWRFGVDLRPAF